jgi:hypothetical protein
MASTLNQLQFIPIAQVWADLELAQKLMTTHNLLRTLLFSHVESEQLWLKGCSQ